MHGYCLSRCAIVPGWIDFGDVHESRHVEDGQHAAAHAHDAVFPQVSHYPAYVNLGQAKCIRDALLAKRKRKRRVICQLLHRQSFVKIKDQSRQALLCVASAEVDKARLAGLPA